MSRKKRGKRRPRRAQSTEGLTAHAPPAPRAREAYAGIPGPWYLHVLIAALLVGGTCLLYMGDLTLGFFHWDDPAYVTNNPWIKGVTPQHLGFVLTQTYFANYSPVHLLSYMLDHALGGLDPVVFHLSSNIWAGIVTAGVYLLTVILIGRVWPAVIAAILFAVHPSHVEAIVWISSRKDLVAAAFAIPAVATYFLYRRGGRRRRTWYAVSLALFTLGVAGKLSVVVVPAILFLFDFFHEGRTRKGWILDKIPYGVVSIFFALRVIGAQPATRHGFELFVFGHSMLQNLWLLTGFGEQVMARGRPDPSMAAALRVLYSIVPLLLFAVPVVLRKRAPGLVLACLCWVLLALVPSQVLSFAHPVADRYLFFPSVGVVLILAWLGLRVSERWGVRGRWGVAAGALVLTLLWLQATLAYIGEWRDPRSVWHAAVLKTDDINAFQYLGTHYQDQADRIPAYVEGDEEDRAAAIALARAVWADEPRLEPLLQEWKDGRTGPLTSEFRTHLKQEAMARFEEALQRKGARVRPNLYFRLGKLAADTADYPLAREYFEQADVEARQHTSQGVRQELAVRCHHSIGLTFWYERDYQEAMEWIARAEAEQTRYGGNWVPDIHRHREQLEELLNR